MYDDDDDDTDDDNDDEEWLSSVGREKSIHKLSDPLYFFFQAHISEMFQGMCALKIASVKSGPGTGPS